MLMDEFNNHKEEHETDDKRTVTRIRQDYPRKVDHDHREEYAAEVAPPAAARHEIDRDEDKDADTDINYGRTAGYVGLAFGIASLFLWSIILGPIAAVVGFYAYNKGSKVWGAWSIGLGILATISYFVLIPFAR